MATQKKVAQPITQADIDALQNVLDVVKSGAKEAHDKGNVTTFRVYQRLAKIVSPEVQKAYARKEREEQARMNKDLQALKERQDAAANGTGNTADEEQ